MLNLDEFDLYHPFGARPTPGIEREVSCYLRGNGWPGETTAEFRVMDDC